MNNTKYNLLQLNTARNCLRLLIRTHKIKELYMPYYICPALRIAVSKEYCKIKYYHIDKNFRPQKLSDKNVFILYPNYFGVCDDIVDELENEYKNLIVDNAHSFYSLPKGLASFNSLRKFFPNLKSGAFLYSRKNVLYNPPDDDYLYEFIPLTYEEFCKNENRLDNEDIKSMSPAVSEKYSFINIEKARKNRMENFNFYHSKLKKSNCLNLNNKNIIAPFCYPYFAKSQYEADELVKKLKLQGINIFRYWNNLPDCYEEKNFYTNLAAIPLDKVAENL